MAKNNGPRSGDRSWMWALALVVVGLPVGWLVGRLPSGQPTTPASSPAFSTAVAPAVARVAPGSPGASPEAPAPSEVVSPWSTLDAAMAEAKQDDKPIFIDFSADWCGPCQRLRHEVFEDATRGRTLQTTVIPVSIVDRRREEGSNPADIESLQERFGVVAFPTLVVFSPRTGRILRCEGFGDAERTMAWITDAAHYVH